jgi:hypothetical protein
MAAEDRSPHASEAAARALREIGPSLAELGERLRAGPDEQARLRTLASISLAVSQMREQGAEAVAPLRAALGDPSSNIRAEAISALKEIREPAVVAVPEILAHLRADRPPGSAARPHWLWAPCTTLRAMNGPAPTS